MSKRALANQEREQQLERMNKVGRSMLILIATLMSFAALGLTIADQLYKPDTFVIDQLKIKGKFDHLAPEQVEAAVNELAVGNFFSVQLSEIKQRVEKLAWVQNADVRREWPSTLSIEVAEHQPVMRWGKSQWVNSHAEVIELQGEVELGNSILLNGHPRDAQLLLQTALRWKRQLQQKGLQLNTLSLSESHAWRLTLLDSVKDNQFELLLGRDQVEQRLARFEFLFAGEFRQANLKLERVDARYPDGLAVSSTQYESTEELVMQPTGG